MSTMRGMAPENRTESAAVVIRHAVATDLPAVLAIRNAAIATSTALWIDEGTDLSERERWWLAQTGAGNPVLVAVLDGVVVGFASYGPWRPLSGFRHTVENSVYVLDGQHGRGIGRLLMADLIAHAKSAEHHSMVAFIESGNLASIRLHERFGFTVDGVVKEAGIKFGRWWDLTIMRLPLE